MDDFGMIDDMLADIGYIITIEEKAVVSGGYSGDTVTWSTKGTVRSSIQNITGDELLRADKLGIDASHWMYSNVTDVNVKDRVLYNGTYYQIQYVDNVIGISKHYKMFLKQSDNYDSESN
jgi:SPP1 family predicted phage head-tail adaptor